MRPILPTLPDLTRLAAPASGAHALEPQPREVQL